MLKKFYNYLRALYAVNKLNNLLTEAALLRAGAKQRIVLAEEAVQAAHDMEIEAYAIMREHGILRDGQSDAGVDNCF